MIDFIVSMIALLTLCGSVLMIIKMFENSDKKALKN